MVLWWYGELHYFFLSGTHACTYNQWVDARPKGRFDGTAPEPDKTLHSGHVLGTTNIPFYDMIDSQTKTLKDKAGLQQGMKKSLPHSAIFSSVSIFLVSVHNL